jgi:hypothetical protein
VLASLFLLGLGIGFAIAAYRAAQAELNDGTDRSPLRLFIDAGTVRGVAIVFALAGTYMIVRGPAAFGYTALVVAAIFYWVSRRFAGPDS